MSDSEHSNTPGARAAPASVGLDMAGLIGHASAGNSTDGIATVMSLLGFGQLQSGHAVKAAPLEHRSGLSGRQHGLEGSLSTNEINTTKSRLNPWNDNTSSRG